MRLAIRLTRMAFLFLSSWLNRGSINQKSKIVMGFLDKIFRKKEKESLNQGLQKTKENFFSKISKAIAGKSTVDEEVLDNLEEALVSADVGIETTVQIIDKIEKRVAKDKYLNSSELNKILLEEIENILVDTPETNDYFFQTELPSKPF